MPDFPYRSALIVGAGTGISASVARRPRSAWSQEVELRPWVEHF
jgi:hypothetical protein